MGKWLVIFSLFTVGCSTTSGGGSFVLPADTANADAALNDTASDAAADFSAEDAAQAADADAAAVDHCVGALAGDGTYCATSFSPVPADAADLSHVLFTCKNHKVASWVSCNGTCVAIAPGKDTCTKPTACPDGTCNGKETCSNCPTDCGACPATCGDGTCNTAETCSNCAKDCGACPVADPCAGATLGDGIYCSASLKPASPVPDTLYTCKAKKTVSSQVCTYGCNVAPSGTADSCKPKPVVGGNLGKGVWVWKFDSEAPPAQQVAIDAQTMGVGFVLIKSGQDLSSYTTNFNASVVQEFTSRGMEVYGWPYVTPGNNLAKAAVIAKAAKIPGVSGIILDVEVEFVKHDLDAIELCDEIRKQAPGVFLGYTTFGWISYHLDFPYKAFDQACGDAFLPQVYWDLWTSTTPAKSYALAVKDAANLGLKAPMWAAQDNEMDPTQANLDAFFAAAGPRANLWRWPNSDSDPQFAKMQKLNWQN
jgi:hypothetical protein